SCFLMTPPLTPTTLFPTRRSSDLLELDVELRLLFLCGSGSCSGSSSDCDGSSSADAELLFQSLHELVELDDRHTLDLFDELSDRSEEHTSELQSRFDLVCRLLLEN